jgi:exoribonuclease-2
MKLRTHSVVLYKGQPAIITGEDSGKLTIKLESDEKKVRDKDIIPLHEGPVTSIDALLSAPLPSGTMEDALDFFTAERPSYRELTELIWGAYPAEAHGSSGRPSVPRPVLLSKPGRADRHSHAEEIALIRFKEDEKMRASEVRSLAIARLKAVAAGKGALTLPEDGQTLQDIEALSPA